MDFSKYIREDDPHKMRSFKGKSPWGIGWWERESWKGKYSEKQELDNELQWLRTKVSPNIRAEYWEKGIANLFVEQALKGDLINNISTLWMSEILFLRSHVPIKDQYDRWITTNKFNSTIMTYSKYKRKWLKTIGDVSKAKILKERWDNQIPKVFRPLWNDSNQHRSIFSDTSEDESCNEDDNCSELEWLREKVGNSKALDYFRSGGTLENEKEWLINQVDKLEFWKMQNKWLSEEEYNKKWGSRVGDIEWITSLNTRYKNQPEIPENLQPPVCTICLTTINAKEEKDEMKSEAIECGHCFHSGCLKQWLEGKNSCPLCRHPIQNNLLENDSASDVEEIIIEEIEVDGVTYIMDQNTVVYDNEVFTNREELIRIGTYDSHRDVIIQDA